MNDKKLTAKQYLDQLRVIDTKINQKMEELADLMTAATSTGAIDYSKDRVQTSPQNAQENRICKYVDLDAEINREIDEFVDIKHRVTKEIQELNVDYYIKILFKVYVQYKTVKDHNMFLVIRSSFCTRKITRPQSQERRRFHFLN